MYTKVTNWTCQWWCFIYIPRQPTWTNAYLQMEVFWDICQGNQSETDVRSKLSQHASSSPLSPVNKNHLNHWVDVKTINHIHVQLPNTRMCNMMFYSRNLHPQLHISLQIALTLNQPHHCLILLNSIRCVIFEIIICGKYTG